VVAERSLIRCVAAVAATYVQLKTEKEFGMNLKTLEENYRLGVALGVTVLIISGLIIMMMMAAPDAPQVAEPAPTLCTPELMQARLPPCVVDMPGVSLTLDEGTSFCPSGGSSELRLWDNTSGDLWNDTSSLNVPIAPDAMRLDESVINGTVFCRTGGGTYQGYVSPTLVAANVGSDAESIGVHAYIGGVERPAFICWDSIAPHADPEYHRIQFRVDDTGEPAECYSGTH
jgi:hypothetical protein